MQHDLFITSHASSEWTRIDAPDADIKLYRSFFDSRTASKYFDELLSSIPWRQDRIRVFGKFHDLPRLQQWYGEPGTVYVWSGISMIPESWTPTLRQIKSKIENSTNSRYNSLLANLYRTGEDTVGWHSDDEPEFGESPTIASLSLGAERDFVLRHKHRKDVTPIKIPLTSGSLLVMSGDTQDNWQHALPRRMSVKAARINLTLRTTGTAPNKSRS